MKGKSEKDFVRHHIRIKKEVYSKLEKLAEMENRTINNMVETVIIRATKKLP